MKRLQMIGAAMPAVMLASGAVFAHPGHGVAPAGTPGHGLDHLADLLVSSPIVWLVLAGVGFVVLRRIARRPSPRPRA